MTIWVMQQLVDLYMPLTMISVAALNPATMELLSLFHGDSVTCQCVTFSPYSTFTPPYFLYDYLIPLVQGHMVIHAALS